MRKEIESDWLIDWLSEKVIFAADYLDLCNLTIDVQNITGWYRFDSEVFMIQQFWRYMQVLLMEVAYTCRLGSLK